MNLSSPEEILQVLQKARQRLAEVEMKRNEPVAVVGIGCRFPGGANPEAFWNTLINGLDPIREVPKERWDVNAYYDANPDTLGKSYARFGGFIEQPVAEFDAQFFGISPREAQDIDPQQRLLLEVTWEALENAGLAPDKLKGSNTGIFLGLSTDDYAYLNHSEQITAHAALGNARSIAAGRLAYFFGLQGPVIQLDTACSSSLVAAHLGVASLRTGESDIALVGGVNLILSPISSINRCRLKALSKQGRCKTFDATADGYVQGEGCGILVLKRLSDALKNNDPVLAVIRGTAVNHDGASAGLTVPNPEAQEQVILSALKQANLSPEAIDYIETHGTGTELGDPIEVNALGRLFQQRTKPLVIGAVKSNIGHLEAAAGVASLIKVILSFQHRLIPPNLHLSNPNPRIPWDELPIQVATKALSWTHENPVAGISTFGLSGTNAHLVIEAPPAQQLVPNERERPLHILTLSAKTENSLVRLSHQYKQYLAKADQANLANICFTANTGRTHFKARISLLGANLDEMRLQLDNIQAVKASNEKHGELAFLFSGQGAQYINMGRALYETQPSFRQIIDQCNDILTAHLEIPLLEVLYPSLASHYSLINQTLYTQPVLFAIEYALAKLLLSWGVKPDVLIGHSIGEYVAACVADVFSLEEGLALVATRSRLMQGTEKGEMIALFTDEQTVRLTIQSTCQTSANRIAIAAINSPLLTVVSGDGQILQKLIDATQLNGIQHKKLNVSHAFHSPLMTPILQQFNEVANRVRFREPKIKIISNITGTELGLNNLNADYFTDHIIQPVRFYDSIKTSTKIGVNTYLELGPKSVLLGLGRRCLPDRVNTWLPSLQPENDWETLLGSLAQLYQKGFSINWEGFDKDYFRSKVMLPNYPFEREPFWAKSAEEKMPVKSGTELPSNSQHIEENLVAELQQQMAKIFQLQPSQLDIHTSFLEMGGDSLILAEAVQQIKNRYRIEVNIRQLFEELSTVNTLAAYIGDLLPNDFTNHQPDDLSISVNSTSEQQNTTENLEINSTLERVMGLQIQAMSDFMIRQLNILKAGEAPLSVSENREIKPERPNKEQKSHSSSYQGTTRVLDFQQQNHLTHLIESYSQRTHKSKQQIQRYRPVWSDLRFSMTFRQETKEMCYPIMAERSQGAKLWDIDGNEYIDLAMGGGVYLFGHNPSFIVKAIQEQLAIGMHLGAQTTLAGEVAELITELSGMERVTFQNSGTEAVESAIRLARAKTGRSKIVIFSGSYHGHSDATLAVAKTMNGRLHSVPMAPGISQQVVEEIIVLPYGELDSLSIIKKQAKELAAVLVEPVQSRHPDLQPVSFVQELRQITAQSGTALILDEVITGFRIAPGGIQSLWEINADLVTYGKVVGGGMPIGIVAGKAEFMDYVDGGMWQYGDSSFPTTEKSFIAGTFSKHPLAMAASRAILKQIKLEGSHLYQQLNAKTKQFATTLNDYFQQQELPIHLAYFGSVLRLGMSGNYTYLHQPLEMDLLYYHMINKGIYLWEGRSCFLSAAHGDKEIATTIDVIKESIEALRKGGFFLNKMAKAHTSMPKPKKVLEIPLTEAQKQLWLLANMDEQGLLAYQYSLSWSLSGALDYSALEAAYQKLLETHEALRTTISQDGSSQIIHPQFSGVIERVDFSSEPTEVIEQWYVKQGETPFDLVTGPLHRIHLLKIDDNKHILVLAFHHILADGWSMGIVSEDLANFYSAKCQNQILQIKPAIQFREFAKWQEDLKQSAEIKKDEAFWLSQLTEEVVVNLPLDNPRPANSYKAKLQTLELPVDFSSALRDFAKQQGVTLFMLMFSAYALLIHRLTGQQSLIIGIPVGGRFPENSQRMVGYCSHLLPIKTTLAEGMTYVAFLAAIKKALLSAYEHQKYPFAWLAEKRNRAPLIAITFNLERPFDAPKFNHLNAELSKRRVQYAYFDLNLNIIEFEEQLLIDCDYKTDIFLDATVLRWLNHYKTLLNSILTHPLQAAEHLPLLTEQEWQQIIFTWNNTEVDYPRDKAVHQLFEEQVVKNPDAIAVQLLDEKLSYAQLNTYANQLANHLIDKGVGVEVLVGICVDRSVEMLIGLLGIFKAGGAYLPLDPAYPKERLSYILQDSKVSLLITQRKLQQIQDLSTNTQIILLEEIRLEEKRINNPQVDIKPHHLAYVIYTSGSTGQPKGVMIEHQSLTDCCVTTKNYYQINEKDRILQFSPISFDVHCQEIYPTLMSGATVVLRNEKMDDSIHSFLHYCHQWQLTILGLPTAFVHLIIDELVHQQSSLPESIRFVITGGERFLPAKVRQWRNQVGLTVELVNVYGTTETTILSTRYRLSSWQADIHQMQELPVGRPNNNTKIYILDRHKNPVPIGIPGEVYIGGDCVGRGYINRPELTAQKFINNPFAPGRLYKTGDLCRFLPDGNIEFVGRTDDQVKIRGFRIELGEIETAIAEHEFIREAVVTVNINTVNMDNRLVAYFVAEQTLQPAELRSFLQKKLPDYMVPTAFVPLQAMPLNPNGKIDRDKLPRPEYARSERELVLPRTETEAKLFAIWKTVLGSNQISVCDNFFEIGGHSLLATQIVTRIRNEFETDLSIRHFFQTPTIEELAKIILTRQNLQTAEQTECLTDGEWDEGRL